MEAGENHPYQTEVAYETRQRLPTHPPSHPTPPPRKSQTTQCFVISCREIVKKNKTQIKYISVLLTCCIGCDIAATWLCARACVFLFHDIYIEEAVHPCLNVSPESVQIEIPPRLLVNNTWSVTFSNPPGHSGGSQRERIPARGRTLEACGWPNYTSNKRHNED